MAILPDKINSDEMKRRWHAQQEDILKDWSEQASCYRWMHERAYQVYKKQNMNFSIPVIVISTITGTANFAQGSFPDSAKVWAPLIIGTLNLAAGLITTIAQFLRVSELLEGHRAASIAYSKLSRNIAVELSLPSDERSMTGLEYIKQCRTDIDRLIEQSPAIPPETLKIFDKTILSDNSANPVTFSVPPILRLEPIDVFRTEIDEEQRMKKMIEMKELVQKQKVRLLKDDQDKIDAAIKLHEERRQSIRGEVEFETIAKRLQEEKKEEQDKLSKKQNLSLASLTKRMTKFNDILTQDLSDSEEDKIYTPPAAIQIVIEDISNNKIDTSNNIIE
ncbi:MAG: hypothetical protein CXT73_05075 [Methanobacteriota archaeon]|nr:MAG: hypothetical protein CXT73_05075 [Euryarchaeota archaeon]